MGKPPDQMVSTLCRQFPVRGGPPFKAVETVGNDHPACLGVRQDLAWERLGNGEVEMVGPLQIFGPFPVACKILS